MVITIWKKRTLGLQNLLILKALQDTTMSISCCMNQRSIGGTMQDLWRLVYGKDSAQRQLVHNKHGIIGRSLFLHQEDGCAL